MQEYAPSVDELLSRGVDSLIGEDRLRERLESGEKLTIKLGIDPTSPHVHLGRTVPLLKLRDFQMLGHRIVFVVGDFTGVIGDTSDKESERPILAREVIEENKQSYFAQAGKIIDLSRTETRYNSDWLESLTYREIGEHADQFSVADFIARDNIKRRLDAGKRVSLREVLYPLMQGYDSVALNADVEIGGTDQRFNMLAGRTLQQHFGVEPQAIIMNPLVPGTDGRKMSSSWGNTITVTDQPADMYGKVMSIPDSLVQEYLTLLTRVPMQEVVRLSEAVETGSLHPRDAKMYLAREIVTLYHGSDEATNAEQAFVAVFQERKIPTDLPVVRIPVGEPVVEALVGAGIVASKSEWRRLIDGGAVRNAEHDDTAFSDASFPAPREPLVIKIGKRRFVRIEPQ